METNHGPPKEILCYSDVRFSTFNCVYFPPKEPILQHIKVLQLKNLLFAE